MAEKTRFSKSPDLQPLYDRNQHRTTPPDDKFDLPLTPPGTNERQRASDVCRVPRMLSAIRRQRAAGNIAPLTEFRISKQQYDQSAEILERDLRRFDYDPQAGVLTLRMPSPVHDFFSTSFADEVRDWLKSIKDGEGEAGEFASKIANGGSSRILLAEADSEGSMDPIRRQPDAQFQHEDTAYPGVVVEVSYSQDGKDLAKLAQDYILHSNGDIKAVIGVDINYGGRESTVSLWRPKYTHNEDFEVLEARQDIAYKPFRSVDGRPINLSECLVINLSDFATDEISSGHESVSFSVPFERLFELLDQAEKIQQAREADDGRQKIKSTRRTKKRRHSSSPVDELRAEDEMHFLRKERMAVEHSEAADEDFETRGPKRRA